MAEQDMGKGAWLGRYGSGRFKSPRVNNVKPIGVRVCKDLASTRAGREVQPRVERGW